MRVIIDTNIFVSGIFWEGNFCSQIIDLWRNKKIILVTSLAMIEELVDTLQTFRIHMPPDIIEAWKTMIIENSLIVHPSFKLFVVKADPDDDKLFEAAVAGKASYIISQDKKHVLSIGEYKDIKTVSPEKFLKLFSCEP